VVINYFELFCIFAPMGRVNTPALTAEEQKELSVGLKQGTSHCFRMRCHCILLKSEGRTSKEVGSITDMCAVSVNSWVERYKAQGVSGLQTQPGRGRKAILSEREDKASILAAIKSNRQRMRTAKAQWEAESGKSVSDSTFKSFLKSLAEDING
jgi:transposase